MEKEKNYDKNLKEPSGMKRDELAKKLAGVINDSYGPAFILVKRECDRDNQNELPKKVATYSFLLSYKWL